MQVCGSALNNTYIYHLHHFITPIIKPIKLLEQLRMYIDSSNVYMYIRTYVQTRNIFLSGILAAINSYVMHTDTSIDVLPSKNEALCEYCEFESKLSHC